MANFKVSEDTSLFLEALLSSNKLHEQVEDAVATLYDEPQSRDTLQSVGFTEAWEALQKSLKELLTLSIIENLTTTPENPESGSQMI